MRANNNVLKQLSYLHRLCVSSLNRSSSIAGRLNSLAQQQKATSFLLVCLNFDRNILLLLRIDMDPPPQGSTYGPSQDSQLQADIVWLDSIRRQIRSPSQRNPDMSWQNNAADLIERQLHEDGHRTWGFVIYRCSYDNDADWVEFLRRLRFHIEDMFDYFNGRDILDKFSLTVLDDRSLFDGASTDAIRQHFRLWGSMACQTEQRPDESSNIGITDNSAGTAAVGIGCSPRYRFAVQVDAEALRSIVHNAPVPPELDTTKKGYVKLIDTSWHLGRSDGRFDHSLEPIEGVTEYDVGWMKVPYQNVMTEYYTKCRSLNNWYINYRRPAE